MSYLRTNGVFISGESYAGIYVPLLSYWVVEHNMKLNDTNHTEYINLNGFMVGNGVTNWTYDTTNATFDVTYYRLLISQALKDEIDAKQCNFSGVGMGDYAYLSEEC
jgi:carboxypeptidase C (cathepsin A)